MSKMKNRLNRLESIKGNEEKPLRIILGNPDTPENQEKIKRINDLDPFCMLPIICIDN